MLNLPDVKQLSFVLEHPGLEAIFEYIYNVNQCSSTKPLMCLLILHRDIPRSLDFKEYDEIPGSAM